MLCHEEERANRFQLQEDPVLYLPHFLTNMLSDIYQPLNSLIIPLTVQNHRTAQVIRDLERSFGPTFHGKRSLNEII